MTGTGTENDPYIVSSWEELESVSGSSNYVKLAADIDMDTEHPEEITSTYTFYELDGQNHKINGLNIKDSSGSTFLECTNLKNVKFTNFKANIAGALLKNRNPSNIEANGILQRGTFIKSSSGQRSIYTGCSFTLKGINADFSKKGSYTSAFRYCTIKISGEWTISEALLSNSRIIGTGSITSGILVAETVLDSYVNVEATLSSYGNILYNSTLNPNLSASIPQATTAQMKDAEYLASIGFPIATEGDTNAD